VPTGHLIAGHRLCPHNNPKNPSQLYRFKNGGKLLYRQPAFLVCTDPQMALEDFLQDFLWRWDFEVNFRDEKTHLGVEQAQVRTEASNQNGPALLPCRIDSHRTTAHTPIQPGSRAAGAKGPVRNRLHYAIVKAYAQPAPRCRDRTTVPMKKIFVSYARKDAQWLSRLYEHLRPLAATGAVELWSDSDIPIGENWNSAIQRSIESASVAILLVSPNYLASEFVTNVELPRLLELARTHPTSVIPIILTPAILPQQLRDIQLVPGGQRALSELARPEQEAALAKTAESIRQRFTQPTGKNEAKPASDPYSKALNTALLNTGVSGSMNISGSANIFLDAEQKLKKGN